MDWTQIVFVAAMAFLIYAIFQTVVSFSWSAEKSARLRRGPTNSPGESLWLLLAASALAATAAFSLT